MGHNSLESEYTQFKISETPDLWERIEPKLNEKQASPHKMWQRFNFRKAAPLMGIAAACLLIIIAFQMMLREQGYKSMSSVENAIEGYTTDQAADIERSYDEGGAAKTDEMLNEDTTASIAQNAETALTQGRKLILSWSLAAEALDFDDLLSHIQTTVNEMGGYVELSSINGKSYGVDNLRSAELTIRVPVEQLDAFVKDIEAEGNVTHKEEKRDDVTLKYTDVESHKTALKTEYDRLLEILESADTVTDIMSIEARLSEVRYQLDYYESQLRTYDNLIEYGTVTLSLYEVKQETPVEERSIGTVIREGFINSLSNIGLGIQNVFVNLIIFIPYIISLAIIALVGYFILQKVRKRRNNVSKKK